MRLRCKPSSAVCYWLASDSLWATETLPITQQTCSLSKLDMSVGKQGGATLQGGPQKQEGRASVSAWLFPFCPCTWGKARPMWAAPWSPLVATPGSRCPGPSGGHPKLRTEGWLRWVGDPERKEVVKAIWERAQALAPSYPMPAVSIGPVVTQPHQWFRHAALRPVKGLCVSLRVRKTRVRGQNRVWREEEEGVGT